MSARDRDRADRARLANAISYLSAKRERAKLERAFDVAQDRAYAKRDVYELAIDEDPHA